MRAFADVEWSLAGDGYDPSLECVCDRCEQDWSVYMTPHQALRAGVIARRSA